MARPRIHMGLSNLGAAAKRVGGGVGFAFAGPPIVCEVSYARAPHLVTEAVEFDEAARRDLSALCGRLSHAGAEGFRAAFVASPPQHSGFGTKTAASLALIAGVDALWSLGFAQAEIQSISGRGGLSGTGIHTFFSGGVVLDSGHAPGHRLLPSSVGPPPILPACSSWTPFHDEWQLMLLLDRFDRGPAGDEERAFFKENLPLPAVEAAMDDTALREGVWPAMRGADLRLLREALITLHARGFKARELAARGCKTRGAVAQLHAADGLFAAGMSSLGPLIYVIIQRGDAHARKVCETHASRFNIDISGPFDGWNSGYEMSAAVASA